MNAKEFILAASCAGFLMGNALFAAEPGPIRISIDASRPGPAIPADFAGLSVSSHSIDGDGHYSRCFTPENSQMVNLFRQIGVKHLRTIMGKARQNEPDPADSQIDAFFDFAAAAGVNKIIWSLHLYNAETTEKWSNNKAVANHIWNTTTAKGTVERNLLESFAFDNEPDWPHAICCADPGITGYDTPRESGGYVGAWKTWRETIASIAPGARFSGPDTGSKWPCQGELNTSIKGIPFTRRFVGDTSAELFSVNQHFYGQTKILRFTPQQMAQACLSPGWITTNYNLIKNEIFGGLSLPYRFTECSPFNNEKNPGNQCFATALWAVDFYHWWAQQGCAGVDPFTRTAQFNAPIFFDGENYIAEPHAYGMKMFGLGSNGKIIEPAQFVIQNPGHINLTAYGVVTNGDLFVTVVNKTFGAAECPADLTIPRPAGFTVKSASCLVLSSAKEPGSTSDPTAKKGFLGGAPITNDGQPWAGRWASLPVGPDGIHMTVRAATAVVIDLKN